MFKKLFGSSSSTPKPKTYKIKDVGRLHKKFPTAYPEVLRGFMTKDEFEGCINRVNEAAYVSMRCLFISIPLFYLSVPWMLVLSLTVEPPLGAILGFVGFIGFFIIATPGFLIIETRKKKIPGRVDAVIEEINQEFYGRGIEWSSHKGLIKPPRYLIITFLNDESTAPGPQASSSHMKAKDTYPPSSSTSSSSYSLQEYPPSSYLTPSYSSTQQYSSSGYLPPSYPLTYPSTTSSTTTLSAPSAPPASSANITNDEEPSAPPEDVTMFNIIK